MPVIDKTRTKPLGPWVIDLTGRTFERLRVVQFAGRDKKGDLIWECVCVCGKKVLTLGRSLNHGKCRSCGCLSRDTAIKSSYRHGLSRTAIYHAWVAMNARCYDKTHKAYKNYGGRGIRVCKRWRDSVADFVADMGTRPSKLHTLDRIDNDGNYEPTNCRWVTWDVQSRNKRKAKKVK